MPYIKKERRAALDPHIETLAIAIAHDTRAGELNYAITRLLLTSMRAKNYAAWNENLGVLEAAKQELYRRAVAPYEDEKIHEHGDVKEFSRPHEKQ